MHALSPTSRITLVAGVLVLAGALGCSQDPSGKGASPFSPNVPGGSEPALARIALPFDSNNFVAAVDNPYFPLAPGTVYHYREETGEGVETNDVEVTHDAKQILGVAVTVVHDRVYLDGSLKEDTFDWYAQDKQGNVWYLGEDTKELENGQVVSTVGSWEAGKDGAAAGIIMLAHPKIGDQYYQENAPGVADQGKVLSLNETAEVPYATYTGCLKTQEWTPIEPGNRAFKYYAPGIGTVLEVSRRGGGGRVELVGLDGP